jgi:acetyl esterase/lipase
LLPGVNYRKSLDPTSAFPGNLLDALSGYLYVTKELGFEPSRVVAMGDSAGGSTCLSLARYLGELEREKKGLGQLGGMILFSVGVVEWYGVVSL